MLQVNAGMRDSREFALIQQKLRGYGTAPTMAEIQRSGQRYPVGENTGNNYPNNPPSGRVQYPSSRFQTVSIFNGGVQVSVPSNWRQVNEGNSVWFVPEGGYGQITVSLFSRMERVSALLRPTTAICSVQLRNW